MTAWDVDVLLADGQTVRIRPIRPADADELQAFHAGLSAESRFLRFFTPLPRLTPEMVTRFTNVDGVDRVALVAEDGEHIVGVGRYDRNPNDPSEAEVAFTVADAWQGRGLGTLLLEHLAAIAAEHGIERFSAETLPENVNMLAVFSGAGYQVTKRLHEGIYDVSFGIQPTSESEARRAERDHRATVASIAGLLHPRVVAVVGDGPSAAAARAALRAGGYRGTVVDDPADAAGDLGLVVATGSADAVDEAIDRAAACDAHAVLLLDPRPRTATPPMRDLVRFARRHGMRVVGPRATGIANTDPSVSLHLLPGRDPLPAGELGVFANPPEVSEQVLDGIAQRGLGVSAFVGAGDKADVSGNDLLEHFEADERTRVIALAVGGFGNPRRFARLARRVGRTKPIVLLAPCTPALAALCRQCGAVQAATVDELLDVAAELLDGRRHWSPPPRSVEVDPPGLDASAASDVIDDALRGRPEGGPLTDDQVLALLRAAGIPAIESDLPADAPAIRVDGWEDASFGPMLAVAPPAGGEPLVAVAPLTDVELSGLVAAVCGPAGDRAAKLEDVLARVGCLLSLRPELESLHLVCALAGDRVAVASVAATVRPTPDVPLQIVRHLT